MQVRSPFNETKRSEYIALYLLTSPDLGAGRGVRRRFASVSVDCNSRVALGRIAGNGGEKFAAGRARATTSDLELGALSVELGGVGLVKSEEFVADEVVAGGKSAGDGGLPVQVLEDVVGSPGRAGKRRRGHALLVNLLNVSHEWFCMADFESRHTLNQFLPDPSHDLKSPAHLYIQTMTGPWAWVHCFQLALTLPPAFTGALRSAEVPPLHMTFLSVTVIVGL